MKYSLGPFLFEYPESLSVLPFEEEGYSGFSFEDKHISYQIIFGHLGLRLLINSTHSDEWTSRDLPLNERTAHFLPNIITMRKQEHV